MHLVIDSNEVRHEYEIDAVNQMTAAMPGKHLKLNDVIIDTVWVTGTETLWQYLVIRGPVYTIYTYN